MIDLIEAGVAYEKNQVLSGVTCTFKQGDFVCVIGKNGCGKSTLLRAVAGIITYQGSILLDGDEICAIPRSERAKHISYLPQTRPVPRMDVRTLIAHGRYPHLGFSKTLTKRDKEHIERAAEIAGLEDLLHRDVTTLSGGERQRAYIAMTMAQDADMLLLDEPTAYLDIEHQLEVMKLLTKLCKGGKGIITVVHDLQQAFSFSSHIILIADGTIKADGVPDEVYRREIIYNTFGVELKKTADYDGLYLYHMMKGKGKNGY